MQITDFFYTKPMRGATCLVHTSIRTYFDYQRFTFLLFFPLFAYANQTIPSLKWSNTIDFNISEAI